MTSHGAIRYKTIPLFPGVKRIDKEIAFENLCLLKSILDANGIKFQLAFGTLLGVFIVLGRKDIGFVQVG